MHTSPAADVDIVTLLERSARKLLFQPIIQSIFYVLS